MNLQSEISELRSLMAEPYRSTDADAFFINSECARWIFGGEAAAFNVLADEALGTMAVDSAALTLAGAEGLISGTSTTVNWNRVLGVFVTKASLSMRAKLVSAAEFYATRHSPIKPSTQEAPIATLDGQSVRIANADTSITQAIVKYLPKPTLRAKRHRGTTTSAGTATTIVDTGLNGPYGTADWFAGCNAQITSGTDGFVEVLVSGYSGNTLTVANMGAAAGTGATYDVGEISSLPPEYYSVWMAYAAFLAANKKRPQLAGGFLSSFNMQVQAINSRYARGSAVRSDVQNEMEA